MLKPWLWTPAFAGVMGIALGVAPSLPVES